MRTDMSYFSAALSDERSPIARFTMAWVFSLSAECGTDRRNANRFAAHWPASITRATERSMNLVAESMRRRAKAGGVRFLSAVLA